MKKKKEKKKRREEKDSTIILSSLTVTQYILLIVINDFSWFQAITNDTIILVSNIFVGRIAAINLLVDYN